MEMRSELSIANRWTVKHTSIATIFTSS
jgi:hypothetical protein